MGLLISVVLGTAAVAALVVHGNVALAVLVGLAWALAVAGNRTRRGNQEPWRLSRSPSGGSAELGATGTTVTGSASIGGPYGGAS